MGKSVGCTGGLRCDGVTMLRQQGMMWEVTVWESEVEGVMREMVRVVDEGD